MNRPISPAPRGASTERALTRVLSALLLSVAAGCVADSQALGLFDDTQAQGGDDGEHGDTGSADMASDGDTAPPADPTDPGGGTSDGQDEGEDEDEDEDAGGDEDEDEDAGESGDTDGDDSDNNNDLEPCQAEPGGDGVALFRISCPTRTPYAVHHSFHVGPESPDGSMLVYTQLGSDESRSQRIWICDADGTDHRPMGTVKRGSDVGARPVWVSNDLIAYQELATGDETVHIRSVSDPSKHETWPGQTISSYSRAAGLLVMGEGDRIWTIDPVTRANTTLVTTEDIENEVGAPIDARLVRPQFSPDGNLVSFAIQPTTDDASEPGALIGFVDADGSNLSLLNGTNGHAFINGRQHAWYDNKTLLASVPGPEGRPLMRINLYGKVITLLAGHAMHGHTRPIAATVVANDAGESPANAFMIYEFEKKSTEVRRVLMEPDVFNHAYYPHPSFAKDGSRVYFNAKGSDDPAPQLYVWVYDGVLPTPN